MITDPNAVAFVNDVVRPAADRLAGIIPLLQSVLLQWNAKGLAATITNTSDLIDDGSATGGSAPNSPDGRTPITGADVVAMITNMQSIQANIQANSNAIVLNVMKIAVNPQLNGH